MIRAILIIIFSLSQVFALSAWGQNSIEPKSPIEIEDSVLALRRQLDSLFVVAKTNREGTDLVAAGTVVVLRKENLLMSKVLLNTGQLSTPVQNVYQSRAIAQTGVLGVFNKLGSFLGGGRSDSAVRNFEIGTKVWITNISVQTSGVEFLLMSDPIYDERFHGVLKFPIPDLAAMTQLVSVIQEVIPIDAPANATVVPQAAMSAADEAARLQQAAEAGEPEAMNQFALLAAQSNNDVVAVRWFEKASNIGHVKATNALGFMYENGRGVSKNLAKANALYLRAMKAADADAMINRGLMFQNGKGINKDLQQAYMHFLLAVAYASDETSSGTATKLKDDLAGRLTKQQVVRGQTMADKFAREEIK